MRRSRPGTGTPAEGHRSGRRAKHLQQPGGGRPHLTRGCGRPGANSVDELPSGHDPHALERPEGSRPAAMHAQERPHGDAGPAVQRLGDRLGLAAQRAQGPGRRGDRGASAAAVRRCMAACRCQTLAPADGRNRSRQPVHPASSSAIGQASQAPTVGPIISASAPAAPTTAQVHHAQPGRQLWRSCSRRRTKAPWAEAPARLDRGSETERAGGRPPDEAVQISSASSLTRSRLRRRTARPAQVPSGRSQRQTRPSSPRLPVVILPPSASGRPVGRPPGMTGGTVAPGLASGIIR